MKSTNTNPRDPLRKAINEGDLKWLLEKSGELHGHFCPGLVYGVRAGYRAVIDLGVYSTGMEEVVAIVETNSCFSDGVQTITGCSFGNNALIYRDLGKTAMTLAKRSGQGIRLSLKAGLEELEEREPEAVALFNKVVVNRSGTDDDHIKLMSLWRQAAFNMLSVPDSELFKIEKVKINVPEYAHIFASAKCAVCGETVMETRTRIKDGKPVCLTCSGQPYYQLAGDGIEVVPKGHSHTHNDSKISKVRS